MKTTKAAASAALIAAVLAAPLGAQTLRGRVVDSSSGSPVSLAYVGLLVEGRDLVVAALAGSDGVFEVAAPDAGAYFLYVSRAGYETLLDGVFELGEGGALEMQVGLKPEPIELDEVTVEAARDRSPLEVAGFYERAVMGRGHFLIREQIERAGVQYVTDAFRAVPAVAVDLTRPAIGSPEVMAPPALLMRRGGEQCRPTLYVDRHVVATGALGPVRPDDYVKSGDVEAIEIYTRSAEVPVEFDPINDCGVVVIWTRMR